MYKTDSITKLIDHCNRSPNDFYAVKRLAVAYDVYGEREKAIALYTRALEIKPDAKDIYLDLATIYYKENRFDLAFPFFRRSLEFRGDNIYALHKYVTCYRKTKANDREFLRKSLQLILKSGTINSDELLLLCAMHKETNDPEEANNIGPLTAEPCEPMSFEEMKEYIFNRYNNHEKRNRAYCALLENHSRRREIFPFLDEEIGKDDGKTLNYFIYAEYLLKDNRKSEAIDKIYEVIRSNPINKLPAYKKLIEIYSLTGDMENAAGLICEIERELEDKWRKYKHPGKAWAYQALSETYALLGKTAEAETCAHKARELREEEKMCSIRNEQTNGLR